MGGSSPAAKRQGAAPSGPPAPRSSGVRGGVTRNWRTESDGRMMTALFPVSDPLPGYLFTWTWRHRVSELGRGCFRGGPHPPPSLSTSAPFLLSLLQAQLG